MEKYNELSFGIDLGIASVGWAVTDLTNNEIIDKGVFLFTEAQKAEERRLSRSTRRLKKRKKHRIERIKLLLDEKNIKENNTYDSELLNKRLKAIKQKVDIQDIVNIIMYFARHRGYIPFKDEDERTSESIDELRSKGYIACEMQKDIYNNNKEYRGSEYLIQHSDYMKELQIMLETQSNYYKEIIDEEFIEKVKCIIDSKRKFWEGPGGPRENQLNKYGRYKNLYDLEEYKKNKNYNKYLFENLIGNCKVYRGEKKTSSWNFFAECFNFYNDIVNLRINMQDLDETNKKYFEAVDKNTYKLKKDSIKTLKDEVLNLKTVNYSILFKRLFLVDFSAIYGYKKDKKGNPEISKFEQIRKIKNKLEDQNKIDELLSDMNYYNKAIYLIQVSPDKKTRYEILKDNLSDKYSDELLDFLANHRLDNRYHSFSEKALKVYLKLMEENNQNSSYIERNFKKEINSDVEEDIIKKYISDNMELKYINSKYIDDIIASPATKKSLRKAISVLNKLFSKYGYPEYICIENTKGLLSEEKQKEYERKTLDNQIKRKNVIKKLTEEGYDSKETNINKYLLLDETNNKCAYCNKDITIGNCEIEHILPRSKTANDTFDNKTVSCTQCNTKKKDRTPYEFLTSNNMYEDFKLRVQNNNKLSEEKKKNLLFELDINKYEKNFKNRNLNDTAYATNELANQINIFKKAYIYHNCGEILETKILKVPGQFTSIVRKRANLEKNRDLKYHHAVDATIVSSIPKLKIGKLINMIQNEPDKYWKISNLEEYRENLYDELYLDKNIKEELSKSDYSNTRIAQETVKKTTGKLFDANISKVIKKDGKYYRIEQIDNIYNVLYKDIDKVFSKDKYFLCKDNDPKLYNRLFDIINMYKEKKVNPFVEYCKENNIVENEKFNYKKHGIRQNENSNSSIVVRLRYLDKVNIPYIINTNKLKKGKNNNVMLTYNKLSSYCTRVYKEKVSNKLLFMPIYRIFIDNSSGEIRIDSDYYRILYNEYIKTNIENVERYMDIYNNEYIRFFIGDKYIGEGFVSGFDKTNNKIEIKNSSKNLTTKVTKIEKIKFEVNFQTNFRNN